MCEIYARAKLSLWWTFRTQLDESCEASFGARIDRGLFNAGPCPLFEVSVRGPEICASATSWRGKVQVNGAKHVLNKRGNNFAP